MKTTTHTIIALLAAATVPLSAQGQNILTNGSFEQNEFFIERDGFPRADDVNGSSPTGWTRDAGTLAEYMTRVPPYLGVTIYNPVNGDYFIGPHDGEWWEQTFATVSGTEYTLMYWSAYGAAWWSSFYYRPGGSFPGLVTVTGSNSLLSVPLVGTSPAPTGTTLLDSPFVWSQHTETFVADSDFATLRFAGPSEPDGGYIFVDDVAVTVAPRNDLRSQIAVSCVDVCWPGRSNKLYQVQYQSELITNTWLNLGAPVAGNGTNCVTDTVGGRARRFYRVVDAQ